MPITLLKDGRYRIRYYADGQKNGRRIQETLPYNTTREEAVAYYRKKLAEAAVRKGSVAPSFWSLAGLMEEYVRTQEHRLSRGTLLAYRCIIPPISDVIGDIRIDRIRPADLGRYQKARLDAGLAPATINREVAFVRTVAAYATAQGWLDRNPLPARSVPRLKKPEQKTRFFSPEEWQELIKDRDGEEAFERLGYKLRRRIPLLVPLWQTLVLTGMRVGEALALRWQDVDLETGRISVSQAKTGGRKEIPISEELRRVLESLPRATPSARIFIDFDGQPLAIGDVSRAFVAVRSVAGLPEELTIHTLRHTFASWLASAGTSLHVISRLLGHTGPQMTNRYAHLTDGARREAVEVVSRIVSGAQAPPIRHRGATVESFPLTGKDLKR